MLVTVRDAGRTLTRQWINVYCLLWFLLLRGCLLCWGHYLLDSSRGIPVNSFPCQLVPMSTRTHVNSYPCQLVPPTDVNSYHKWCQLVPQVMSTRTQQGKYKMLVRVDIYYHTIDVNSYPCHLVPMSTRTTKRCQLVPSSDVNSYLTRQVSDDGTSWHLL